MSKDESSRRENAGLPETVFRREGRMTMGRSPERRSRSRKKSWGKSGNNGGGGIELNKTEGRREVN